MIHEGGYKGYGLMFMVEILTGILSGARFGHNVRTWQSSGDAADLVNMLFFALAIQTHINTFECV